MKKILLTEDMYGLYCKMYNNELATITKMGFGAEPKVMHYRIVTETNIVGVDKYGINGGSTSPDYKWNIKEILTKEKYPEYYL